eukprot:TRINITY_DN3179_c3_g1_i1.p1 TRINITY_DN3179_c3_g1~~TRINITY_DN3179_c3_g1_i1.p1  ORF type:complete len:495 (+),score=112.94 TRINITY_DN3179_c3_g1_i1:68-1552(+)
MPSKLLFAFISAMVTAAASTWTAVDTLPTTNAYGLKIFGTTMFVADASSGFRVVDITDPTNMVLQGTLPLPGSNGRDIILGPNPSQFVYIVGWAGGFHKIDVSNPSMPTLAATTPTPGLAYMGEISGGYAFVADQFEGLQIISLATMAIVKNVPMADISRAVTIHGNYAYVSNQGPGGVHIIDISNIATASVVATYYPGSIVKYCAVTPGGVLYIVSGTVTYVTDISSTPTAPIPIKSFTHVVGTRLTIDGTHGYLADWQGGMRVVEDVTDPANVQITQTLASSWLVSEVQFSNGYAFFGDGWGGVVSAVETPPTPVAPVVMSGSNGWMSSQFNGQRVGGSSFDVLQFPRFLDNTGGVDVTVHLAPSYPIPDNTEISVTCNNPNGCDVFVSVFSCPACSGSNGGIPAALLASQWESGSCSPRFQPTGSSSVYPMTAFFNHIPQGTTSFTTTGTTDYLAIIAANGVVANSGTWCYKQHGPAISGAGCASNCPPSL